MTKMGASIFAIAVLFVIFGLTAGEAKASSYDLKSIFNGAIFDSENNFMRADFENSVIPDTVTLTLTSFLSNDSYYIQDVAFNVNPAIAPSDLTITVSTASGTFLTDIANTTQNAQNLPGGGTKGFGFDVLLSFPTANTPDRFNNSDTIVLTITGTGITADSFNFLNDPAEVANVGAHIALGGGLSSAVSNVPIPPAAWLLASGLLSMVAIPRRYMRRT